MTIRVGCAFLFLLIVGTGTSHARQSSNWNPLRIAGNGVWWASLSDDTKRTFVDGYVTAMGRVYFMAHGECLENTKKARNDDRINATLQMCMLAEIFNFTVDPGKLQSATDDFYKDSQNVRIPVQFAIEHARDTLAGKRSTKELDDELTEWRRIMK
jgi:hypothetical protein